MKMEEGRWIDNILIINGIRVKNWKEYHDDFMKARKDNNGYDEGSRIFELHEDVVGLDGYWIGDVDNPDGLVIGCLIDSLDNSAELNFEEIQKKMDEYSGCDFSDYENWVNEFLETENEEFKLYVIVEKLFKIKEEIIYNASKLPKYYKREVEFVKEDKWELRGTIKWKQ